MRLQKLQIDLHASFSFNSVALSKIPKRKKYNVTAVRQCKVVEITLLLVKVWHVQCFQVRNERSWVVGVTAWINGDGAKLKIDSLGACIELVLMD